MAAAYQANDKYRATLRSVFIDGTDTTLAVTAIPANLPTLVTVNWNTAFEAVFAVTGTSGSSSANYVLTGVTKIKGYTGNQAENSTVNCLNHEEFFNQFLGAANADVIELATVASAVNKLKATNAATGNAPKLETTGTDTNIDFNIVTKGSGVVKFNGVAAPTTSADFSTINGPRGFVQNGKFVVSVASNDLTVALKGLDGNDPSSSNKVYVRIGDTVRTITSALSVTKNDGTNWFDSGGAELATLETDYFVYLGYNATDGVVIGFARIPWATKYGDFSATTTNASYAAISTITTAASTDYYENIGRFAAILSATASFNWSVPTFTAINLIQQPCYETRWAAWTPVHTGFSAGPTGFTTKYKIRGAKGSGEMLAFMQGTAGGTSNNAVWTITLPYPTLNANFFTGFGKDNGGSYVMQVHVTSANSKTVTLYPTAALGGNWTASGTRNSLFSETIFQLA